MTDVSETLICNRALQKLGAARITSRTENSSEARACNTVYELLRDAELRAHPWNFAGKRVQLAAESTVPSFGKAYQYPLPTDFLKLREDDVPTYSRDWIIEGKKILTDEGGPLNVRYTKTVTDVTEMDPLFIEALACKMAIEMCEELTQSNSKKESAKDDYKIAIKEARRANAFDRIAQASPEDEWITVRK